MRPDRFALALLISSALVGSAGAQSPTDAEPILTVPAEDAVVMTGSLRAADAELLSAPVTSVWQLSLQWLVDEGAVVSAGDPVARFDPAGVQDNLYSAQDSLLAKEQERDSTASQADLQRMKLELEHKRAEVELRKAALDASVPSEILENKDFRERQLKHAEAKQAFEVAERNLLHHESNTRSTLAALDVEIEELHRSVRERQKELDSLELRAARDGIVIHEVHPWLGRKVQVGDQLQATFPVARIPDLGTLEVEAWAGETDAARLEPGQPALYRFDAYPDRAFVGLVRMIAQAGERRVTWGRGSYVRVRLQIDELDPEIMKPGMSVRCEIDASTRQGG